MASSENLTILITDIADFTERTSSQSRQQQQTMHERHDTLLRAALAMYEGEWIKSTGDGMLAVFRSPTNALQCGMAIQDMFAEYNYQRPPAEQIHVRAALNLGEVRRQGDRDVFGEAVNVCARVEALAPAGEVYFTQAVYLAMNKAEVPNEPLGSESIRGIPEPVELFRVPTGQLTRLVATGEEITAAGIPYPFGGIPHPSPCDQERSRLRARRRRRLLAVAALLFVLVLIAMLAVRPARQDATAPGSAQSPATGKDAGVRLTVQPQPADARVRILNIRPPYTDGIELAPGRYQIEVSRDGYQTRTQWLQLQEDQELTVQLPPAGRRGTPRVDTDPEVQLRNDLFLVLSRTLDGPEYFLRQHPGSDWALVFRIARHDDTRSLDTLRQHAESGRVEAQLGLAYLYGSGKGVRQSATQARRWLTAAARRDAGLSAWLRASSILGQQRSGTNGARDSRAQALRLLGRAADQGEALAQVMLGTLLLEGKQVAGDRQAAARRLQQAAAQGMGFAEAALAGLYLEGTGVDRDVERAVELLQRSAGRTDPTGQYYLGLLHERGFGVSQDRELARTLYRASAAAGFPTAREGLDRLR